ncbi:MAG: plastocyanin/azurin family copper-binding protein [Dokdonella sp.]|uniref:cupredoxin domain-containing protein n=1 Tax=Dokdonella sp. TaxID=2291710 RepID=UPI003267B121
MRGFVLLSLACSLVFFTWASNATAATYIVTANPDITFTPQVITIRQNDRIRFENAGGLHNVIADDGSFACGFNCNTNTSPSDRPWSYTIAFTRVGAFGYFCEQHGDLTTGMRGTVIVLDNVFFDGFDGAPTTAALQR